MAIRKDDKDERRESGGNGAQEAAERTRHTAASAMEAGAGMTERGLGQATDFGRFQSDQMRSMANASARVYRDMTDDSRVDVDAIVQTSTRLAKGIQDMGWEMLQFSQQSLRLQLKTANDLMTCRSVEDMVQVQRDFLRETMDTVLQESARLLEMSSSVTGEAIDPLKQRTEH